MDRSAYLVFGFVTASVVFSPASSAQSVARKAPTAADWTALAKLPDFTGVWEVGLGGGGGRAAAPPAPATPAPGGRADTAAKGRAAAPAGGGRGRAAGPSLTPAYAAKTQARANAPADDTANCLPPGLPAIMNQPYPMEFLLTIRVSGTAPALRNRSY